MHLLSRGLLPLLLAATPASGGKNLTIVWGTHDLVVQETEALCYRIECARARRAHLPHAQHMAPLSIRACMLFHFFSPPPLPRPRGRRQPRRRLRALAGDHAHRRDAHGAPGGQAKALRRTAGRRRPHPGHGHRPLQQRGRVRNVVGRGALLRLWVPLWLQLQHGLLPGRHGHHLHDHRRERQGVHGAHARLAQLVPRRLPWPRRHLERPLRGGLLRRRRDGAHDGRPDGADPGGSCGQLGRPRPVEPRQRQRLLLLEVGHLLHRRHDPRPAARDELHAQLQGDPAQSRALERALRLVGRANQVSELPRRADGAGGGAGRRHPADGLHLPRLLRVARLVRPVHREQVLRLVRQLVHPTHRGGQVQRGHHPLHAARRVLRGLHRHDRSHHVHRQEGMRLLVCDQHVPQRHTWHAMHGHV